MIRIKQLDPIKDRDEIMKCSLSSNKKDRIYAAKLVKFPGTKPEFAIATNTVLDVLRFLDLQKVGDILLSEDEYIIFKLEQDEVKEDGN